MGIEIGKYYKMTPKDSVNNLFDVYMKVCYETIINNEIFIICSVSYKLNSINLTDNHFFNEKKFTYLEITKQEFDNVYKKVLSNLILVL